MIASDTSALVAYISGDKGPDMDILDAALASKSLVLPPVVISEMLSDPDITKHAEGFIDKISTLVVKPGFWHRAGKMRSLLLRHGLKAKLADTFIAQFCIDHGVALITRDKDFRNYAKHCGLKLHA